MWGKERENSPRILLEIEKVEFGEADAAIVAEENAWEGEVTQRNSSSNVLGGPLKSLAEDILHMYKVKPNKGEAEEL